MLSNDEFKQIHSATVDILSDVGFHISDQEILEKLNEAGLAVDFSTQAIKFTKEDIDNALSNIPEELSLYNKRSGEKITFGDKTLFMPSGTGIFVLDPESGERRNATSEDVKTLLQMQEELDQVDIARPMVTANDIEENGDLYECYLCMRHTDKPFLHRVLYPETTDALLDMAWTVAGGKEALREKPFFFVVYCPKSPLTMAPENIRCALAFAKAGVPVLVLSMAMGGATAPVTLAGEALLINAEVLAGIVIIQTMFPGAPVLYGSVSSVLDMKTGVLALGAPERGVLNGLCADLAAHYRIPSVMGGLSTDAKQHDEQAGSEKVNTCLPLMGRANLVFGMGNMDSAGTYSCEQLIIDDEIASAIRVVDAGIGEINLNEEATLIKKMGFKGDYLTDMQTLKKCRSYWQPEAMARSSYINWETTKLSVVEKAKQRMNEILEKSIPSLLSNEVDSQLQAILRSNGVNIAE
jgi:trimethylamine--corrinoid protein Co-methyltransferase